MTWRRVSARRDGDRWVAAVPRGREGYVSLRAKVTDADGSSAERTVVRAYRLTG